MSSNQMPPYPVRLPDEMREKLSAHAKAANRSLHAEILLRLQQTLEDPSGRPDLDAFADQVAEKVAAKLKKK